MDDTECVKEKESLTYKKLVSFAYQVARGMEYLAAKMVCILVKNDIFLDLC